jgi:hypothetical protein
MEKNKQESPKECNHYVQFVTEAEDGTIYQVCKRCKRRVIVREGKERG